MEDGRRKRIKVDYVEPPELKKYNVEKNFGFFARNEVPSVQFHRSLYLHTINVLLEETANSCTSSGTQVGAERNYLDRIDKKLFDYAMNHRSFISKKHRILLWVVRARLCLILTRFSDKWTDNYGSLKTLNYIAKVDLLISTKAVHKYSLAQLWRALKILVLKINELRYHDQLIYYIDCLQFCCGKFLVLPKSDPSLFNYIRFCEKSEETGEYQINELYITETERIFYGLHRKIRVYQSFRNRRTIRSASGDGISWFYNWIVKCSQGPFLEFVERDLGNQTYEWHVHIGERERYDEEEPFGDPTGYNVIAKYRPDHIDQCIEELKKPNSVALLLARIVKPRLGFDGKTHADVDCDGLCVILLNYCFDSIFTMSKKSFEKRYVNLLENVTFPLTIDKEAFPLIVKSFNEYGVYFNGCLIQCPNFATCFIEWIRIMCEKSTLKGRIPGEPDEINLIFIYSELFPKNERVLNMLAENIRKLTMNAGYELKIEMPNHYS